MPTLTRRPIIEIDEEKCDGCGLCVPACAEGAIQIIGGKARLVSDRLCDGLGACLGHCPRGAITVVEREAEDFGVRQCEGASVRAWEGPRTDGLATRPLEARACGGGAGGRRSPTSAEPNAGASAVPPREANSGLRQWPVQLTLVPPHAPFLQGADLLVAADCVPFAFADFHGALLAGRALLVACPKLDNLEAHRAKLRQICTVARPRSITVAIMEVPCCRGLALIAHEAAAPLGIPVEVKVIGIRGTPLD